LLSSVICPYAVLPPSFEQYLATVSPSVRYNFRRRLRNLKRQHNVEFISVNQGPELESGFDTMVDLHRMRFEQRQATSVFITAKELAFHRGVLHQLAAHRTFGGVPPGGRRRTDYEVQTYLTSWDKTTAAPGSPPATILASVVMSGVTPK
jgi:hypothetical protein